VLVVSSPAARIRSACVSPGIRSPSSSSGNLAEHSCPSANVWPDQPDDGRACAKRPGERSRVDPGRRRVRDRHRIDDRGSLSRAARAASSRPNRCGGDRGYARRRAAGARFGCSPRARGIRSALRAPATPSAHRIGPMGAKRTGRFARERRAVIPLGSGGGHERMWIQAPRSRGDTARPLRQLRALDSSACDRILVEEPPDTLEWTAIRDRLTRAGSI